ncbi:MAG TPA: Hsp70 family protein [Candidatus Obscuribacterales bacterium]
MRSAQSLLRTIAEIAKIELTQVTEYAISTPNLFTVDNRALGLEVTLTRIELETLVQPFINRTLAICDATLEKAGMKPSDIDQVLLVGGQTRLPAVKAALRDRYGWTINDSVNPDEAVARGAAVLGARLCGYLKEEVKLWDITPLSLGIELVNGKMDAIIRANEQIPVTKWRKGSQAFTTQRDGQESIRFRIYQGERPMSGMKATTAPLQAIFCNTNVLFNARTGWAKVSLICHVWSEKFNQFIDGAGI